MLSLWLANVTTRNPSRSLLGESPVTSLDCAKGQQEFEVVEVSGPRNLTNSLAQLGIRVGELVRVRRAAPLGGALLIETAECSVALGRSLAHKVKVRIRK